MSFELTENARLASEQISIEPNIVLCIEGVDTKFGGVQILKYVRIGDPGLLIGNDWVIGGFNAIDDQSTLITFDGTTTQLTQQLNPDRGIGSSVSYLQIALVDINAEVTELISPGFIVTDLLGRRAQVYLGFADTAFPDDYIIIHRGIIDDIISKQGAVVLNIAHPDQKKRQTLFKKIETQLNGMIDASTTTITVDSTTNFLTTFSGTPTGVADSGTIRYYIRIDDEIIQYTGLTATTFTGCTRNSLSTTAATHADNASVSSFYRLTSDAMTLALKLMLSGWNDNFATGVEIEAFEQISATESVDNAIFFFGVDVEFTYNLVVGDFITTVSATNGANNVTLKEITEIVTTNDGSYIVIDGVTFVNEPASPATISFRSQYDTLGEGLKMHPDEVDINEHLRMFRLFLSTFDYDFYLKDTMENAKEFIEQQIYRPAGAYSIPRKAQASVGMTVGPIPGANMLTLDDTQVKKPGQLQLRRTITRNFNNDVIYKFDVDALDDKFLAGTITTNATSKTQIPIGSKAIKVEAEGMRTSLSAVTRATQASNRWLNRYAFGAEFFEKTEMLYGKGFNVEVGDIVIFDGTNLNITDTKTGTRGAQAKLYEVTSKSIDFKTGAVSLTLVDTNFSTANRYGLISPSSKIKSGISTTQFIIKKSYNSVFGNNEFKKWDRYPGIFVRIRSPDFSLVSIATEIVDINANTITVSPAIAFTPAVDYVMFPALYNDVTEQFKLIYGFMRNTDPFDDGKNRYRML